MTTLVSVTEEVDAEGLEYRCRRYVGKIKTHEFVGNLDSVHPYYVERFRSEPVQFQSEVDEAQESAGPPEAA